MLFYIKNVFMRENGKYKNKVGPRYEYREPTICQY